MPPATSRRCPRLRRQLPERRYRLSTEARFKEFIGECLVKRIFAIAVIVSILFIILAAYAAFPFVILQP